MAKVTRLGAEGYGVERIRSFAGKTPSAGGPHPVGIITRLGSDGYGVKRAGSFAGKGGTGPSGTLAATEGADSAAFTGSVLIQGTLAATEGADTAAFTGTSGAIIAREVTWPGTTVKKKRVKRGKSAKAKPEPVEPKKKPSGPDFGLIRELQRQHAEAAQAARDRDAGAAKPQLTAEQIAQRNAEEEEMVLLLLLAA